MQEIQINWSKLISLGVLIALIAICIVLRMMSKTKGGKKKDKKKKGGILRDLLSSFKKNQDGQAMTEFVIIAITLFFCIMGVIQLALALNAFTMVRYAAYNAARAAIVHGGDKLKMEEAARISLLAIFPSHGRADNQKGMMENYLSAKLTDSAPFISGSSEPITKVEIVDDPARSDRRVVTFDDPKDAKKGIITVKVTHQYQLVVPLANRMLYYVYKQVLGGGGYSGESMNQIAGETDAMRRTGSYQDIEYRIQLVGFYTMRMQSDLSL